MSQKVVDTKKKKKRTAKKVFGWKASNNKQRTMASKLDIEFLGGGTAHCAANAANDTDQIGRFFFRFLVLCLIIRCSDENVARQIEKRPSEWQFNAFSISGHRNSQSQVRKDMKICTQKIRDDTNSRNR